MLFSVFVYSRGKWNYLFHSVSLEVALALLKVDEFLENARIRIVPVDPYNDLRFKDFYIADPGDVREVSYDGSKNS